MPSDDGVDELIDLITVDAYGDEGHWCFLQAFEDEVTFPLTASLVGVSVVITSVDFNGNAQRGLVAAVEREGTSATISILDLDFAGADLTASRIVAAYRRWLGIR